MERRCNQEVHHRFRHARYHPGRRGFRACTERIATFDNDGTLWCEQPVYSQVALDEAAAKGWTVVDMKKDWKTIFPQHKE
jgi:hypothetical protein